MNPVCHIHRLAAILAGLAAVGATRAFARMVPLPGEAYPGHVAPTSVPPTLVPARIRYRTLVASGMAGWQIALIAAVAAA